MCPGGTIEGQEHEDSIYQDIGKGTRTGFENREKGNKIFLIIYLMKGKL